ncbi:MAG: hypothetical protein LCH54_01660 [Bacteroidetes bacterium]|nr:hypothetical protein [Bacteroidota bacterium]
MKTLLLNVVMISALSLMMGCDNEEDKDKAKDPVGGSGVPATQTGAGTMGATIDGNAWVAGYSVPVGGAKPAYGSVSGEYVFIYGFKVNYNTTTFASSSETIQIFVKANAPGTYPIGIYGGTGNSWAVYTKTETSGAISTTKIYYTTQESAIGSFTLSKFDKTGKIVSGTFNFKGEYTDPATSAKSYVNITNGVFDIVYN